MRERPNQPDGGPQVRRLVACSLILAIALVAPRSLAEDPPRVAILYGAASSYREAAVALTDRLRAEGCECLGLEFPASDSAAQEQVLGHLRDFKPQVIATGGTTATGRAIDSIPEVPVLFFMVPNALDAPFLAGDASAGARLAGVAADVSPRAQIDWIRVTHPDADRIAILHSDRSDQTVAALREAARARGISIIEIDADRDRFPEAITAITESDCGGVLMIPDASVYNSPTVQRLLLWGVRRKKPVWTFSANVVKAGALSGMQCEPAAVGRQTAELVREVLRGKKPAELGLAYPSFVQKFVNVHTAEMIDVSLEKCLSDTEVERVGERQ